MENAWICFSFCLEEAQCCKSAMHFARMCGVVEIKESFEDTFICVGYSVSEQNTRSGLQQGIKLRLKGMQRNQK